MFGVDPAVLGLVVLAVISTVTGLLAIALPSPTGPQGRIKSLTATGRSAASDSKAATGRLLDGKRDSRRKQIQESLRQAEARSGENKKGVPLRLLISRAGLDISVQRFWIVSILFGGVLSVVPLLVGLPWFAAILTGIAATLGLPRWVLSLLAKRRQAAFIEGLADAIDVMVRGLKAGLPLSDAMRVIATETSPPIGPEFTDVVEGQRVGITLDQGLERMYERMPLPEVSFLGIVINIQSKAGGNLSEALGNLSRVLRERKKIKAKIRSMSQEAKSSAAIIGVLPFFIVGALLFTSPAYLTPLLSTGTGHMILAAAGLWMGIGILVMRGMINFDI